MQTCPYILNTIISLEASRWSWSTGGDHQLETRARRRHSAVRPPRKRLIRPEWLSVLTVVHVGVLHPKDAAAAEHHLVLRQGSGLVGEQVLDLAQVLSDVEGPALDPGVQLFVVQLQVVVDEVDLAQFHKLDGHVERDGDQHLMDQKGQQ